VGKERRQRVARGDDSRRRIESGGDGTSTQCLGATSACGRDDAGLCLGYVARLPEHHSEEHTQCGSNAVSRRPARCGPEDSRAEPLLRGRLLGKGRLLESKSPFGQNARLRGGIEEETEGAILVSTRHGPRQFPLHPYNDNHLRVCSKRLLDGCQGLRVLGIRDEARPSHPVPSQQVTAWEYE
jgi:hypothetical protein